MKKIILLFFSLCLLLCSCGFGKKYECNVDAVESVKIVEVGEYSKEEQKYETVVLCEISNCSEFVNNLNELKQQEIVFGDPHVFYEGAIAIEINYINGDYDLVTRLVQLKHRSGEFHNSQIRFDSEQFGELVDKYWVKEETSEKTGQKTGDGGLS